MASVQKGAQAMSVEPEQINDARRLLKPTPVKKNHVPKWFRRALLKAYGRPPHAMDGHSVIMHAKSVCGWEWLEHWGSTTIHGRQAFVSEPYPYHLTFSDLACIVEMCQRTGLKYRISPNAWHYPGKTFRVLIFESDGEGSLITRW